MLIKAYQLLMQAKPQQLDALLKVFNQTAIEVCEGQQMDMDFESIDLVEEDQYLEMIRLKTSVLLGCSLQMGAITANASAIDMAKLYHFGVNVGMGFQLMDDYLDAFGASELVGKKTGGDILAGKKTVMVIYTMKSEPEALRSLFTKKEIDDDTKVEEVKNLFVKTGADVYLKTLSDQYFNTAIGYLDSIKTDESSKKPLRELAIGLMDRKF
jgi:geranylgeranyl diphosphate synthase type II